MKILFLSRWFPYPTDNGAKLRIYHLLRGLTREHEVHLASFADDPKTAATGELSSFCRSVRLATWKEYQASSWRALLGLFSPSPRSLADTYSAEMEGEIRRTLGEQRFDLVVTSQWQMTAYRHLFPNIPVLFEEIEVGVTYGQFINAAGTAARLRGGLTWLKHRHFLRELLADERSCTVVSEEERQLLQAAVPRSGAIHVVPNGVNIEGYAAPYEPPEPNSLIFTGSFRYKPNYQAMVWFIEKILPRIQEQVPGVTLTITGDNAGLPLPGNDAVTMTGFVDDVRPLVARSWASVVPLQVGGGTRLKILESMALHTPVISTSKGAQGIDSHDNKHLLIADNPEDFARCVVRLFSDLRLREQLSLNAYQLVRDRYDWNVIIPGFLKVVEQAASYNRF